MNDKDKYNLQFMLTMNDEDFTIWFKTITDAEANYALNLLQMSRKEIDSYIKSYNDNGDYTEAKNLLKRFTLKGN